MKLLDTLSVIPCLAMVSVLTGCHAMRGPPMDFTTVTQPNRVVTETITIPTTPPPVAATFPLSTDTRVIKAYETYSRHGTAEVIHGDGFITYPFDAYSKPLVQCAPLHLCIVQLQQGESVNDIALGDSAHWQVSTALIGTQASGAYQISLKPTEAEIATDLVIATNQRSYHLGLVSDPGSTSQIVSFYYPETTLQQAIHNASRLLQATPSVAVTTDSKDHHTSTTAHHHIRYRIHGDKAAWRPLRAFDDGHKTFIHMPPMTAQSELPVLYLLQDHQKQWVNYRYQAPYLVIDGLFQRAYLIAGQGRHQTRVLIDNEGWQAGSRQQDFPRRVA